MATTTTRPPPERAPRRRPALRGALRADVRATVASLFATLTGGAGLTWHDRLVLAAQQVTDPGTAGWLATVMLWGSVLTMLVGLASGVVTIWAKIRQDRREERRARVTA